jgi:hypothetical protein
MQKNVAVLFQEIIRETANFGMEKWFLAADPDDRSPCTFCAS